jgi:uncharacterized Tic20 family protein
MADGGKRDLLSIGALLVIIVVCILLYQPLAVIRDWTLILPFALLLCGFWIMVLAGMQASNPKKYELGPFGTLSWGLLLAAIGGAWLLYGYGFDLVYSIVLILLVFAIVAIVAALKKK